MSRVNSIETSINIYIRIQYRRYLYFFSRLLKVSERMKWLTKRPARSTRQMKATEETTTTAIAFPESASDTRRNLCIWKELMTWGNLIKKLRRLLYLITVWPSMITFIIRCNVDQSWCNREGALRRETSSASSTENYFRGVERFPADRRKCQNFNETCRKNQEL